MYQNSKKVLFPCGMALVAGGRRPFSPSTIYRAVNAGRWHHCSFQFISIVDPPHYRGDLEVLQSYNCMYKAQKKSIYMAICDKEHTKPWGEKGRESVRELDIPSSLNTLGGFFPPINPFCCTFSYGRACDSLSLFSCDNAGVWWLSQLFHMGKKESSKPFLNYDYRNLDLGWMEQGVCKVRANSHNLRWLAFFCAG